MLRAALLALVFNFSTAYGVIDLKKVDADLQGPGLKGWVHGAVDSLGMYVFTVRNGFFDHLELSMVAANGQITAEFLKLNRHDELLLKGRILQNPSPQPHMLVESIQMIKKGPPNTNAWPVLSLKGQILRGLVHAVSGNGAVLVADVDGVIIPVFTTDTVLTRDLYRGDRIEFNYTKQTSPHSPVHLNLDTNISPALRVLDSMLSHHNQPLTIKGYLVRFAPSPQISRVVYGILENDTSGINRIYTLVNFDEDDGAMFNAIQAKAEATWKKFNWPSPGRNYEINYTTLVTANGTGHIISPSQANPQIWLKSDADLIVP